MFYVTLNLENSIFPLHETASQTLRSIGRMTARTGAGQRKKWRVSAKYWLGVLNEIRNRGVEDIMIVLVDGLTGFGDAINAVFLKAEIQRCIVHQIRYSTKFISYKDIKPFMKDLALVYKADTEEIALGALDDLDEKWDGKYPSSVDSWRNNWPQLATYFKYPPGDPQDHIYNEFHRELQPAAPESNKTKDYFPH